MELKEVFEPIINFIKGFQKKETENSKVKAKERLKLVLYQDRASVSPDYFEMMKKELVEVIKKYVDIDEELMEVELTRLFEDGLDGPALVANIPIKNFKPVAKKVEEKKEEPIAVEEKEEVAGEIKEENEKQVTEETQTEKVEEKKEEVAEEIKEETKTEEAAEEIKEETKTEEAAEESKEEVDETKNEEQPKEEEKKQPEKKETTKKTQSKSKKSTKK